jgi:hypothetical protein
LPIQLCCGAMPFARDQKATFSAIAALLLTAQNSTSCHSPAEELPRWSPGLGASGADGGDSIAGDTVGGGGGDGSADKGGTGGRDAGGGTGASSGVPQGEDSAGGQAGEENLGTSGIVGQAGDMEGTGQGGLNSAGTTGGSRTSGASGEAGTGLTAGSDGGKAGSAGIDPGGAGAGGDHGQSAWTPAVLPGLVLWLDAGVGVARTSEGRVERWQDRSGASAAAIQETDARRPLFHSRAGNGLPAVVFDGEATLAIPHEESPSLGSDDFFVAIVAAWSNSTVQTPTYAGYGQLLCKTEVLPPFTGLCLFANYPLFSTPGAFSLFGAQTSNTIPAFGPDAGMNDGWLRLYAARRAQRSRFEARVNGSLGDTVEILPELDVGAPGSPLELGGNDSSQYRLRGLLAEVVLLRGETSSSDVELLEGYLNEKYGLW